MNFNFENTSSDDDDIDLDAFDDTGLLALTSRQSAEAAHAESPVSAAANDSGAEDDDADSDIDWEDAYEQCSDNEVEEYDDLDRKMPALPSQGVTVTFSSTSNTPADIPENVAELKQNEETNAPKKRKRTKVLKDVPHHTQQLILGVRRSHMLCHVARSMRCSSICSTNSHLPNHTTNSILDDEEDSRSTLLSIAYSLVPSQFHSYHNGISNASKYNIPTNQQLYDFSQWFFRFVNAAERRRTTIRQNAAQGAVTHSPFTKKRTRKSSGTTGTHSDGMHAKKALSGALDHIGTADNIPSANNLIEKLMYLSPYYDDDPQMFINDGINVIELVENITPLEKVLFFLTMVRSLKWRSRLVTALDPLPLQLTIDHPLLELTNLNTTDSSTKIMQDVSIIQRMVGLMEKADFMKSSNIVSAIGAKSNETKYSASRKRKRNNSAVSSQPTQINSTPMSTILSWVEVLCANSESNEKAKWVAIFPGINTHKNYDAPLEAEVYLSQLTEKTDDKNSTPIPRKQSSKHKKVKSSRKVARRKRVSYVIAVEHSQSENPDFIVRFTDVTPRYASSWSHTMRLRGATGRELAESGGQCKDEWWADCLRTLNQRYWSKSSVKARMRDTNADAVSKSLKKSPIIVTKSKSTDGHEIEMLEIASSSEDDKPDDPHFNEFDEEGIDNTERKELEASISKEPIPKSKAAFKQHPQYVILSVLNVTEVLHPDARKHICGVFKGEMVYRRKDVSKALRAKQWLYQGRKVKDSEIGNPVKKVKARMKRAPKGFQALTSYVDTNVEKIPAQYNDDDASVQMNDLYGIWQTKPWSPPIVCPSDQIPVNEFKNVELALINPGLTHMEQPRLSVIAKKLGISYAPCMCGYERHNGNQTPTVRGIVVHNHNVDLLNEAYIEYQSQLIESEVEARRQDVVKKWKRLVIGILTKDRLDRAYG